MTQQVSVTFWKLYHFHSISPFYPFSNNKYTVQIAMTTQLSQPKEIITLLLFYHHKTLGICSEPHQMP